MCVCVCVRVRVNPNTNTNPNLVGAALGGGPPVVVPGVGELNEAYM